MLDSLGIAAIVGELAPFLGGFVQRTIQSGPLSHALRLHARGRTQWLYVTADPEWSGLWLTDRRLTPADEPKSPIALLARKWIQDARLTSMSQPPFERRVDLTFAKRDDEGREVTHTLIVEATGRLGNIILVDDAGVIIDAVKRVSSRINRVRQILPRRPYVPPPPRDLLSPFEVSPVAITAVAANTPNEPLARALPRIVRGISPMTAREVAFRVAGNTAATVAQGDPTAVVQVLRHIAAPVMPGSELAWTPSVALENGVPVAAAPYELTQAVSRESVMTTSEAIDRVHARGTQARADGQRPASVDARIIRAREHAAQRRSALSREGARSTDRDALREAGELILAYSSAISPGATEALLGDRIVLLDPTLNPIQNANSYFERYAAARETARRIPVLMAEAENQLRELDDAIDFIEIARDAGIARSIVADLESRRILAGCAEIPEKKRQTTAVPAASSRYVRGGALCLVGRSARENERVTFDLAKPSDLWLHARGVTGSHVILQADKQPSSPDDIEWAAGIAAYFSRARGEAHVRVDVVERRHVRRAKGGPPGAVTYSAERTLSVRPTAPQAGRVAP
ncbi:MAG: DUF814 domain-containing protein [Chloroflexota bacterium]|nr:MAG: DUF814 domain-containing protein [Chloroflexota bacterium]